MPGVIDVGENTVEHLSLAARAINTSNE